MGITQLKPAPGGVLGSSIQTGELDDNSVTDAKIAPQVSTKITGLPTQTTDEDRGGTDIRDLSNLEFRETAGAPLGSTPYIFFDSGGLKLNVLSGDEFRLRFQGDSQYVFDSAKFDMKNNMLQLNINQTIVPSSLGLAYNIPTGDIHDFKINGISTFSSSSTLFKIETGFLARSGTAGIVASTTQTQGQQPLTTEINEVDTVANTNDTVTLPTAVAFINCVIINDGVNSVQIFPASGDDLGDGVNVATTLSAGSNIRFIAIDATNWKVV